MKNILIGILIFSIVPILARAEVTLTEDSATYTLANGIVTARVAKVSGDLVSLRYKNKEMLATFETPDGQPDLDRDPPGANPNGLNRGMTDHQYGFWSHDAMGPRGTAPAIARVTIDPKTNAGARAEVSVKGIAKGRKMGTGPGASADGQFAADVEIRYALGDGESGVYTYCAFEHPADYPTTGIGEARFCAKLAATFDWLSVSPARDMLYPKELHEGDKYIYTVVQSENPAFGWSSTTEHVGFYILNPSMEYMSGGPTKVEFQGHRDTNAVSAPCVLNYWRSSHYGGAEVNVAEGEHWAKVIGPFMLYLNSGENPRAMFDDAKAQQKKEAAAWPYTWVAGVDYPRSDGRGAVQGQLVLEDPSVPEGKFSHVMVGLVAPDYISPRDPGPNGAPPPKINVNWQTDAKHFEFWTRGDADGHFEIPKVRPGSYTLHAFADGVLGEFVRAEITVGPGKNLDLGKIAWTPVRHGKQLWEIGVPNRNGSEFFKGDVFWKPEISLEYAKLFPDDVHFVVGKSDSHRDWFFQQVPHNEDPAAKPSPYLGNAMLGRATPFTIAFDQAIAPHGTATLRLAICGTGARTLDVTVNDKPAGTVTLGSGDGVITRHGIQGIWYERELAFDAALMKAGNNTLTLTVPAGPVNNGVVYDYLRLELNDAVPSEDATTSPSPTPPMSSALPSLFIAGDSTAARGQGERQQGWGVPLADYFDAAKIHVVNRARGGRSSRTFVTEGSWDKIVSDLKASDFVLIQFGTNDGGALNDEPPPPLRARGTLPGLGGETKEIDNVLTKQHEIVHTYGWYLRKMVADTVAKGATPIVVGQPVRDEWKDGHVERGVGLYNGWAYEVAGVAAVPFIDLANNVADRFEAMGEEKTRAVYQQDHVHFDAVGADIHAQEIVACLKGFRRNSVSKYLSAKGEAVEADKFSWLRLPVLDDAKLPTLFLVGDSTVRNGSGDGGGGQWGWGDFLGAHFDLEKINVVNRAVGGTGVQTFNAIGHWQRLLSLVRPGDYVMIQFGHNDNGARAPLKGVGDETEEREDPSTKEKRLLHTWGWYLRQDIAEIRAKGATPIVCSLIPRKIWKGGKIARNKDAHAGWAEQVATAEKTAFVDLNEIIAAKYDTLGHDEVMKLFPPPTRNAEGRESDEHTHTNLEGAKFNAECVVAGLKALPENPVASYLKP